MTIDIDMAKQLLGTCIKYELRDHAFGDVEVEWWDGETHVGTGYFGAGTSTVSVLVAHERPTQFKDAEARELRSCFASERVERNDMTGPPEFEVGKTMPGLTKEGVFEELTRPPD